MSQNREKRAILGRLYLKNTGVDIILTLSSYYSGISP